MSAVTRGCKGSAVRVAENGVSRPMERGPLLTVRLVSARRTLALPSPARFGEKVRQVARKVSLCPSLATLDSPPREGGIRKPLTWPPRVMCSADGMYPGSLSRQAGTPDITPTTVYRKPPAPAEDRLAGAGPSGPGAERRMEFRAE